MAGAFENFQDWYNALMDDFEDKGFPQPRVLIPVIAVLGLALLATGIFFLLQSQPSGTRTVTVSVNDASGLPVPSATVKLVDISTDNLIEQATTDANGYATFSGVSSNTALKAIATANGFSSGEAALGGGNTIEVRLGSPEPAEQYFVLVQVTDASSMPVSSADVKFDVNGQILTKRTGAGGSAQFDFDARPTSAVLTASKDGFKQGTMTLGASMIAAAAFSPITIILQPDSPVVEKGIVEVTVEDAAGNSVNGARVSLYDASTDSTIAQQNAAQGTATFEDLDVGKRFYVHVTATGFEAYDSTSTYTVSKDTSTVRAVLTATTVVVDAFKITVKDDRGVAVPEAEITVFNQNTNRKTEEGGLTDESGQYETPLGSGTFYVTAWKAGYLPGFAPNVKQDKPITIVLAREAEGNYATAEILVDESGAPAPGASVDFFVRGPRNGAFLGIPTQTTGIDGRIIINVPLRVDGRDYSLDVRASKGVRQAQEVHAVEGDFEANLTLRAPPAFLTTSIIDKASNGNVSSARVTLTFNATQTTSCNTALNGSCAFVIESGEEFTIRVEADGYLGYETAPMRLNPLESRQVFLEIYSRDSLSSARASFEGIYDEFGNRVLEIENAQLYKAKFRLDAPQSTLAGLYVRVGRESDAQADYASIAGFNYADAPNVSYGRTLSTTGCSTPANESFQRGFGDPSAKWVEYSYGNGLSGSKEYFVDVFLQPDAPAGDNLEISYRGYAVANDIPSTAPADDALNGLLLGKNTPITQADFCVAAETRVIVPISTKTLKCDESGACYRFYFVDSEGRERGNGFPVELGDSLDVNFTIADARGLDSLSVSSPYYDIAGYTTYEYGEANYGALLSRASLGDASGESIPLERAPYVKARGTVHLIASKPGPKASIDFGISSANYDAEPVRVTLVGRVNGKNTFSRVDSSASTLELNVQSRVTITLRDALNKPVTDATVTLADCSETGALEEEISIAGDGSRGRGQSGAYSFSLRPVNLGTIGVRVEHPDFQPFDTCTFDEQPRIDVDATNFVTVDPESLSFTGTFTGPTSKQVTAQTGLGASVSLAAETFCNGLDTALSVEPVLSVLDAPRTLSVTLNNPLEGECLLLLNARASPTVTQLVSIPITVNSLLPPTPTPAPYQLLNGAVTLVLDESATAQTYRRLAPVAGESSPFTGLMTGCTVSGTGARPAPDGALAVLCSNEGQYFGVSAYLDLSDDALCFTPDGLTARLAISRTINDFPAPDYIIGITLAPSPALLAERGCVRVTPTPTPIATATPTPTTASPLPHCTNGVQDTDEAGVDCGGASCSACGTINECFNELRDPGELGVDCGGACTQCSSEQLCVNGLRDADNGETGVDCGGNCASCSDNGYESLPSTVTLLLDDTGLAEAYYSISAASTAACEIRSLDASAMSPAQFVFVDTVACRSGVVHLLADYSRFPTPPGLYKNLAQTATLRISRTGEAAQSVQVRVLARNMNGINDNPIACGDGVCQSDYENSESCSADCSTATCGDGLRNGDEEGIDCGGACSNACTSSDYPPLPGNVALQLNDEAFAQIAYDINAPDSCQIVSCEVRSGYTDSLNPATQISNFVSVDPTACTRDGVAQIAASYTAFPGLYSNYRAGGSLYVFCADGTFLTRPLTVSASQVEGLPLNAATCSDGRQNQDEEGVDCGGPCAVCSAPATCSDNLKNGVETGIDCGGSCPTHCVEDLYAPLPNEIRLYLDDDAHAVAYYHTKALGGQSIECSDIVAGFVPDAEPDESITNFVTVTCSGNIVTLDADYAGFPVPPGLSRNLVQGGTFRVIPQTTPPLPGKTIRVIVSAARVSGAPAFGASYGLSSLPSSASLVVLAYQQGATDVYGGTGGFGFTTPNARTYKIRFKNPPSCELEGFIGGGNNAYGGDMPSQYGSALDPYNSYPGQAYSSVPQIVYPSTYPIECQVPQVLYAPWDCQLCASQFPDHDYSKQRQQYPTSYGNTNGYGSQYGSTPYAQQSVYGGQSNGYAFPSNMQYGTDPFSSGASSMYTTMGQPYGNLINAPSSCLAPSVCGAPQNCALFYCSAQMMGGTPRQDLQISPPTCDENELSISAQYYGDAPQSAFTATARIKVTETTASGSTKSKTIPLTVLVFSAQNDDRSSQQILYCANGYTSQRASNEKLVRIVDANADAYGLPKEIVVKVNPLTLKGSFGYHTDVVDRQGRATALLCSDKSFVLPDGGTKEVKCADTGSIAISVDLSGTDLTSASESPLASGNLEVQLGGFGGPARVTIPITVVFDDFTPAGIQLFFTKKTRNEYVDDQTQANTAEDAPEVAGDKEEQGSPVTGASLSQGASLILKGDRVTGQPSAAGNSLSFSRLRIDSLRDLDAYAGELALTQSREKRVLPVYAAHAPDAVIVKLAASGSASYNFYWQKRGAFLNAPVECSLVDDSDTTLYKTEKAIATDSKQVTVKCTDEKLSVTVNAGANNEQLKMRGRIEVVVGRDSVWGKRSFTIPLWVRGSAVVSPAQERADREKQAAEAGVMIVRVESNNGNLPETELGIDETRAQLGEIALYPSQGGILYVKFPSGEKADKPQDRKIDVTSERVLQPSSPARLWALAATSKARAFRAEEKPEFSYTFQQGNSGLTSVKGKYTVTITTKSVNSAGKLVSKQESFIVTVLDPGKLQLVINGESLDASRSASANTELAAAETQVKLFFADAPVSYAKWKQTNADIAAKLRPVATATVVLTNNGGSKSFTLNGKQFTVKNLEIVKTLGIHTVNGVPWTPAFTPMARFRVEGDHAADAHVDQSDIRYWPFPSVEDGFMVWGETEISAADLDTVELGAKVEKTYCSAYSKRDDFHNECESGKGKATIVFYLLSKGTSAEVYNEGSTAGIYNWPTSSTTQSQPNTVQGQSTAQLAPAATAADVEVFDDDQISIKAVFPLAGDPESFRLVETQLSKMSGGKLVSAHNEATLYTGTEGENTVERTRKREAGLYRYTATATDYTGKELSVSATVRITVRPKPAPEKPPATTQPSGTTQSGSTQQTVAPTGAGVTAGTLPPANPAPPANGGNGRKPAGDAPAGHTPVKPPAAVSQSGWDDAKCYWKQYCTIIEKPSGAKGPMSFALKKAESDEASVERWNGIALSAVKEGYFRLSNTPAAESKTAYVVSYDAGSGKRVSWKYNTNAEGNKCDPKKECCKRAISTDCNIPPTTVARAAGPTAGDSAIQSVSEAEKVALPNTFDLSKCNARQLNKPLGWGNTWATTTNTIMQKGEIGCWSNRAYSYMVKLDDVIVRNKVNTAIISVCAYNTNNKKLADPASGKRACARVYVPGSPAAARPYLINVVGTGNVVARGSQLNAARDSGFIYLGG